MIDKSAARKAAFARRAAVHRPDAATAGYLSAVLAGYRGVPIAGYMAMRTEIDPTPPWPRQRRMAPSACR